MPHLTRRQFLKLSAASLSVPALIRSSALGLDGSVPANERVTMGVLGCGLHSTNWNIPLMLANREQQIVAVCDPDAEHLAKAENQVNDFYSKLTGQEYKVAACRDFRDVVNRKDVDAVDVITPDHWHVLMSVFAMKAGKHVIAEKPVLTLREGQRLMQVQKETGRVFLTASQIRTVDTNQQLVNICRNKIIGNLKNIKVLLPFGNRKRASQDFEVRPIPETLDYELWTGPAPLLPYIPARLHVSWRNHFAYSGGTLPDWAAHYVNWAYWANDSDRTPPVRLTAITENPQTRYEFPGRERGLENFPPADVPWTTTAGYDFLAEFRNGVTMHVWSDNPGIKFEGDEGWVLAKGPSPYDSTLTASSESILSWTPGPNDLDVGRGLEYCMVSRKPGKGLQGVKGGEHVHFSHCVKTGQTETYYPAWLGFNTDVTALAANIMMLNDFPSIEWDAENQKFTGENAEIANQSFLVDRPQREPWTFENVDSWINVG